MLAKPFVSTVGSKFVAVGAASANVSTAIVVGKPYVFASNTACWIKQGVGAQTAVAGAADNTYVPPNTLMYIHGSFGDNLAVIQDAAGGKCSLSPMAEI